MVDIFLPIDSTILLNYGEPVTLGTYNLDGGKTVELLVKDPLGNNEEGIKIILKGYALSGGIIVRFSNGVVKNMVGGARVSAISNGEACIKSISTLKKGDIIFYESRLKEELEVITLKNMKDVNKLKDRQAYFDGITHALGVKIEGNSVVSIPTNRSHIVDVIKDFKELDTTWRNPPTDGNLAHVVSYLSGFLGAIGKTIGSKIVTRETSYNVARNVVYLFDLLGVSSKIVKSNLSIPEVGIMDLYIIEIEGKIKGLTLSFDYVHDVNHKPESVYIESIHELSSYVPCFVVNVEECVTADGITYFT
jgi:hypothetical protein